MKRLFSLLLSAIVMASALAGCTDRNEGTTTTTEADGAAVNELAANYSDSSEMPDWEGKQIELKMWYGTGSYSLKREKMATEDVVTPELFRVTGVKLSEESYDNNGEMQDAKLAKTIATNEWPDVIWGCQTNVLNQLIEQDLIWELSDLIPKYMPNLYAYMQSSEWMKSKYEDGSIYEINLGIPNSIALADMDPEVRVRTEKPKADTSFVYVRDDILKQLKPEAYTQDELVAIYEKNGGFTEEEILNASINSKEEFYQFLRDIKALGLKTGNRDVYATYALAGSDNWDFLAVLAGALNGCNAFPSGYGDNYFTYFDVEKGKIEYMYEQDFFKETVRELTQLVSEDIISQDSLIDNRANFEEKCSVGQYAVLYGGTVPDIQKLNDSADGYKYRKVTLNIPWNKEKFMPTYNEMGGGYAWCFLKNQIAEEDLPQILRYFDFMLTDVGQKLAAWGPKSAGLFEEDENGVRRFTNKELEANWVYGEANDAKLYWGLNNEQWPGYPVGPNRWNPIYVYDFVPNMARLNYFYSTGVHNPLETVQSVRPDVYNVAVKVPEASRFWNARTAFETNLTKVLTATNDEEFEKLYQATIDDAARNGLTKETLEEINEVWKNDLNKDYMNNVEEYLKEYRK